MIFRQENTVHIYFNIIIRPVKQIKLSFSSIEINKPLPAPFYSVFQVRCKCRSQLQLLPQIRCLTALRVERSIFSIGSNTTDSIIRQFVVVQQEKCKAQNRALRNISVNWVFLGRLPIKSHLKPSISEKRQHKGQSKAKYQTRNLISQ